MEYIFVVTAVIAFLTYFSDVGLAAALIQKKENISEEDLRTTFTIQQGLVISISLIALISSSFVKDFYKLDSDGVFLFQALVISFFLSSLKTIPSIILERELKFEKLVIPQIAETLVFNVIAVFMAMQGFGVAELFNCCFGARRYWSCLDLYNKSLEDWIRIFWKCSEKTAVLRNSISGKQFHSAS